VEDYRLTFSAIISGFQKAALLLGFVVIASISAISVQAQDAATTNPKTEIKGSLTDLSNLYKSEVERLEKRHDQSQQLYNDGLISRVEFEKGEKELTDARAKVEQVAKEIAAVNQPASLTPAVVADLAAAGSSLRRAVWRRSVFDLLHDVAGVEFQLGRDESERRAGLDATHA
jgi:hypothetical protein